MFVLQMVLLSLRKADFIAGMRGIDATGNVCDLKGKMNAAIEKLQAAYASDKKRIDIVHLNVNIRSIDSICSRTDEGLFVSSDVVQNVYQVIVEKSSHGPVGNIRKNFCYPENDTRLVTMTITAYKVFKSSEQKQNKDNKGGLSKLALSLTW